MWFDVLFHADKHVITHLLCFVCVRIAARFYSLLLSYQRHLIGINHIEGSSMILT